MRKGPEEVYLKSFLKWFELVNSKDLNEYYGIDDPWNCDWARGVLVTDPQADQIMLQGQQESNQLVTYIEMSGYYFGVIIQGNFFEKLAEKQKALMNEYLWCPEKHLYYDWDCSKNERISYESVTSLWPLWAGLASPLQASLLVHNALALFEKVGGLVSGTEESRGEIRLDRPNRQWDYPFGWAPHQILTWQGLQRYGFLAAQERLIYKWLYTIIKAFVDFNGVIPEKFDVVQVTHKFTVEYGNVGSDFKCVVKEGFGWMNASIQVNYINDRLD